MRDGDGYFGRLESVEKVKSVLRHRHIATSERYARFGAELQKISKPGALCIPLASVVRKIRKRGHKRQDFDALSHDE
jgi:hypothetical protein